MIGPETGTETHTIEYWSLDNRGNTEAPHKKAMFTVSEPEHIPPVTTSNAQTSYVGTAVITLTPTDEGGSGVAATKYRVDGGPEQTGTTVTLRVGPYGSVVPHSVEFWSVDASGNEETPHNTVDFTVAGAPDSTAPSTGSDVKASYVGPATIQLTPTDTGGSGVATTYYRLDGATQQAGTTISVPAPSSGSEPHTIEFWSVDVAGNIELPHKTASFTVAANAPVGTGTITLMWNAPDGAWAEYWIYDGLGRLVAHADADTIPGWYGWYTVSVPVSAAPYRWYTEWYDPEWEYWGADDPWGSTEGLAPITANGVAYSSWY